MKTFFLAFLIWHGTAALANAPPAAFDFKALRQLIEDHRPRSIEELLAQLPVSLRANFVLVFDSRSLQGGNLRNPRVILFRDDGKFVVTFNGDPNLRGYDDLELMEFRSGIAQFELRELHFGKHSDGASVATISEANPERCTICHGKPPHPVWDTFPTWPGVYGERYLARLSRKERSGLADFLSQLSTHPRYRLLQAADYLAQPDAFTLSTQTRYGGIEHETVNARLTTLFGRLNLQKILHELEQSPEFSRYRYALLAALDTNCASAIAELVPRGVMEKFRRTPAEFDAYTEQTNRRQLELKGLRAITMNHSQESMGKVESLNRFRYLVEEGMHISTNQWTLAMETDTFDFSMPQGAASELEQLLLAKLQFDNDRLRDLRSQRDVSDGSKYCRYLAGQSRSALVDR